VKEILGKKIDDFVQSEINPDEIDFQNKNQGAQFEVKKEKNLLKKRKLEEIKAVHEKKMKGKTDEKQKRTKGEQRKTRKETVKKDIDDLGAEERLVKKLKKGQIGIEEFNRRMKEVDSDDPFDTEYNDRIVVSKSKNVKKKVK